METGEITFARLDIMEGLAGFVDVQIDVTAWIFERIQVVRFAGSNLLKNIECPRLGLASAAKRLAADVHANVDAFQLAFRAVFAHLLTGFFNPGADLAQEIFRDTKRL